MGKPEISLLSKDVFVGISEKMAARHVFKVTPHSAS